MQDRQRQNEKRQKKEVRIGAVRLTVPPGLTAEEGFLPCHISILLNLLEWLFVFTARLPLAATRLLPAAIQLLDAIALHSISRVKVASPIVGVTLGKRDPTRFSQIRIALRMSSFSDLPYHDFHSRPPLGSSAGTAFATHPPSCFDCCPF
jgi:hypothetical protein